MDALTTLLVELIKKENRPIKKENQVEEKFWQQAEQAAEDFENNEDNFLRAVGFDRLLQLRTEAWLYSARLLETALLKSGSGLVALPSTATGYSKKYIQAY